MPTFTESAAGRARRQTAEIMKTFNQRCPEYTVTDNKERANFAVILDHEGGKGVLPHRNKIAVLNREGDAMFSDSTSELGNALKICELNSSLCVNIVWEGCCVHVVAQPDSE